MTAQHRPTGTERVLELLRRGYWFTAAEIEERCEVTCHSRISDLRHLGHLIDKRRNPGATGRRKFSYRLIATADQMRDARETTSLAEPESAYETPAGSGSASDEEGRSVVDGAGVEGTAAAATTSAPERTSEERSGHTPADEPMGECSAEGERIPPSAEPADFTAGAGTAPYHGRERPAADLSVAGLPSDETEDHGWRELMPVEPAGEALPPPSPEQLVLEAAS